MPDAYEDAYRLWYIKKKTPNAVFHKVPLDQIGALLPL